MTIQEIIFELTDASGWEIDCMGQERYDELWKELEQARIEAKKQIKQLIESELKLTDEQRNILEKL